MHMMSMEDEESSVDMPRWQTDYVPSFPALECSQESISKESFFTDENFDFEDDFQWMQNMNDDRYGVPENHLGNGNHNNSGHSSAHSNPSVVQTDSNSSSAKRRRRTPRVVAISGSGGSIVPQSSLPPRHPPSPSQSISSNISAMTESTWGAASTSSNNTTTTTNSSNGEDASTHSHFSDTISDVSSDSSGTTTNNARGPYRKSLSKEQCVDVYRWAVEEGKSLGKIHEWLNGNDGISYNTLKSTIQRMKERGSPFQLPKGGAHNVK